MRSYDRYGARRWVVLLAVIQTILLTASLILSPALTIAQDAEADAAASPASTEASPAVEEPTAAEPEPATAAEPKAEGPKSDESASPAKAEEPKEPQADPQPAPPAKAEEPMTAPDPAPPAEAAEPSPEGAAPQAEANQDPNAKEPKEPKANDPNGEGKAEAGPAEVAPIEPERKLFISSEPKTLDLTVGESARLSAWLCSVGETLLGPDAEPGTADDTCVPAKDAAWSVEPVFTASFGKDETAKTRLTAVAATGDAARVIAELGALTDSARLTIAAAPEPKADEDSKAEPGDVEAADVEQPVPGEDPKLEREPQGPKPEGSKVEEQPDAIEGQPVSAEVQAGDAEVPAVAEAPIVAEAPTLAQEPGVAEEPLAAEAVQELVVEPMGAPPSLDACAKGLFFDSPLGVDYYYWLCAGFEGKYNNASTWEAFGFGTCVKTDGSQLPGNQSYTLAPPPAGTAYTLLILKPGNNQILIPDGDPATGPGPVPGDYYWSLQQGLSHVISCYRDVDSGTKSGVKFEDLDADGTKDPGEPGLEDWTIKVFNDNDSSKTLSAGDTLEATQDTGIGGVYSFSLDPGDYIACEEARGLPGTWLQSRPSNAICEFDATLAPGGYAFTITSGGSHVDNDFGNYRNATKSGVKFEDLDADGQPREAGEPGVAGVTINLVDAGTKQVVASTPTAADGSYSFGTLTPGVDYLVCESSVAPAWTQSYPSNAACAGVPGMEPGGWPINLTSNQTDSGNDFGNYRNATKSGVKFHDLDADGVRDGGEPGLSGWTINLVGTAGDGSAVNLSTATDATGAYSFSVKPGTYTVSETQQAGWTQSYPDIPGDGDWDIILTSGQNDTGNDFGNWRPATKSGVKFEDLDADGQPREAGEPGVGGVTIWVDYDNDGVIDAGEPSAVTATDGTYSIAGIKPGTWRVKESAPAGWTCSFPTAGAEKAPVTSTGCFHQEVFTSGAVLANNDFGNWRNATKTGVKYDDRNGNGAREVPQTGSLGEPGLPGWTITAFAEIAPADGILQQPEIAAGAAASAVTDANGNYSLTLKPGRYIVVETMQSGWNESPDADTTQVNPDGRGGFGRFGYAITLTSGQTDSGNDFGNVFPTGGGQGGGGGPEKGGGGEGGGGQPPTDTLIPTDSVSAASGPTDGISWILLILMSATVILSAGWVIRRVRTSEI